MCGHLLYSRRASALLVTDLFEFQASCFPSPRRGASLVDSAVSFSCLFVPLLLSPNSFIFSSIQANAMTITKEQAAQWAGSATAEQLTKLPSPSDGRLRASTCLTMLKCSTEVVHCFIEGGTEPPILPLNDSDHYLYRRWCEEVLRRDARKTQTSKGDYATRTGLANRSREDDPGFLVHEREYSIFPDHILSQEADDLSCSSCLNRLFVRLFFRSARFRFIVELLADPLLRFTAARMHDYISEAVSWMLHGGRGRNNFRPLLWVGLRDWETSSAWTRGVVSSNSGFELLPSR